MCASTVLAATHSLIRGVFRTPLGYQRPLRPNETFAALVYFE